MHLFENPFHVLNVSPIDMRERIIDAAEERKLFGDPEECSRCCSDLLNPQRRLAAELGWFTNHDSYNGPRKSDKKSGGG